MMSDCLLQESQAATGLNPAFLPAFSLYQPDAKPGPSTTSSPATTPNSHLSETPETGWELSPTPFFLTRGQYDELLRLGPILWRFWQVLDQLYKDSLNQTASKGIPVPAWVAGWLNQGKPDALLQFSHMKRFRAQLPLVIRPDLLLTDTGFALTEIDSVPGGIGFTSALNQAYRQSGFSVIEPALATAITMPDAFLAMLKGAYPEKSEPTIALVVSDEAADYRLELQWLVTHLQAQYPHIHLVHPKDLDLIKDRLVMTTANGEEVPVDVVYRFFELFDLPNIPKVELLQYAMKKKFVFCTPPFKPQLEEKMMMALLHHPMLQPYWAAHLESEALETLHRLIPPSWVVDPSPLPPHAVIAGLSPGGKALQSFEGLSGLSQKERQLVLKPSGFSELAWGSRGVTVGHDVSGERWQAQVQTALTSFPRTPYILQQFRNPSVQPFTRLNLQSGEQTPFQAKTRLCPYYFILDGTPVLSGVLATACPADKKIIHGMRDAVLAPCTVAPEITAPKGA